MSNYVQNLSSDAWSSEIDFINLDAANPYEKKGYFNRYFFVAEKAVAPYRRYPTTETDMPLTIVDAACGDGSGSAFLAEQFPLWRIIGVDCCGEAIDLAKARYGGRFANVSFLNTTVQSLEGVKCDIFVSMETLEHVTNDTMHEILGKVAHDILLPGGRFVASMPRLRPRESTKKRPGHINELYYQQFKYELGGYFPFVEFYSFDRYANIVPDTPDANLMVALCRKWCRSNVFNG